MRARRVKGLNRKVFYRNLKENLNERYLNVLDYIFEDLVDEYEEHVFAGGIVGEYELKASESATGKAMVIWTN